MREKLKIETYLRNVKERLEEERKVKINANLPNE